MIEEVKNYLDSEDNKAVTAYTFAIDPDKEYKDEEFPTPRFEGTVGIPTPYGVKPLRFQFPEGYTLHKCFEDFDKVAEEEVPKIIEAAQEQQKEDNLIVTPRQASQQGGAIPFPG